VSTPDDALADRLAEAAESVVEVGVGNRPTVAAALVKRGVSVTATDLQRRPVPDGVRFVRDDITDPDLSVYEDSDVVYARNLPPELHRPALAVARDHDATFMFTTLGTDQPLVPVERETVPADTLFVARG
jgi:uncharacterized UPF0146 family protein